MKKLIRRAVITVVILGIIGAGAVWYLRRAEAQPVSYRTAEVKRGDLAVTISATGTAEPEEVVDVGAQVAGLIKSFGTDKDGKPVDYGSNVKEGTVLAQVDDSLYACDVAEATAQVAQAQAGLQNAEANLGQMKAKLGQAQADWERAEKLGPSEALAA